MHHSDKEQFLNALGSRNQQSIQKKAYLWLI